jgi:LysR family transcriptional regulator, glycine cleavage system transcriptional activator
MTNETIAVDVCKKCMYVSTMARRKIAKPPPPTPPRRRRPVALSGLRGFECAARQLSFTRAAEELSLTQSSISRQIATLEHQVGMPLFVRKTRALGLTAAGARLLAAVAPALHAIDRTVDEIRGLESAPRVNLTTYASFASMWLVPRLAEFQHRHPGIEIRIDATDRSVDLVAENVDIAIRHCLPSRITGADAATLLCEEFITPALSPQILERSGVALRTPADLLQLPLIDLDEPWPAQRVRSWAGWLDFAGAPPGPATRGRMTFSFVDQATQAAVRGQGVVMGRTPMLEDAVAAGQLATPFPELRLPTGYCYYLLVNPDRASAPPVKAFAAWLAEEFARGPRRQS